MLALHPILDVRIDLLVILNLNVEDALWKQQAIVKRSLLFIIVQ